MRNHRHRGKTGNKRKSAYTQEQGRVQPAIRRPMTRKKQEEGDTRKNNFRDRTEEGPGHSDGKQIPGGLHTTETNPTLEDPTNRKCSPIHCRKVKGRGGGKGAHGLSKFQILGGQPS